jgi:hypothetical protein
MFGDHRGSGIKRCAGESHDVPTERDRRDDRLCSVTTVAPESSVVRANVMKLLYLEGEIDEIQPLDG